MEVCVVAAFGFFEALDHHHDEFGEELVGEFGGGEEGGVMGQEELEEADAVCLDDGDVVGDGVGDIGNDEGEEGKDVGRWCL